SSHREAPNITQYPALDSTDLYAFMSYEPGREGYVTLLANYLPLQDPYGGPNYFALDQRALYEIHVDSDGDAREDLSFQFAFDNDLGGTHMKGLSVPVGGKQVAVPLKNIGGVAAGSDNPALNFVEKYRLMVTKGDRHSGQHNDVMNSVDGGKVFTKPY